MLSASGSVEKLEGETRGSSRTNSSQFSVGDLEKAGFDLSINSNLRP